MGHPVCKLKIGHPVCKLKIGHPVITKNGTPAVCKLKIGVDCKNLRCDQFN